MGFFSKGLENEFEIAMVNEPSVFKPLKVYCKTISCYPKYPCQKTQTLIFKQVFQRKTGYLNDERRRVGGANGCVGVNNCFPEHNPENRLKYLNDT